MIGNCGIGIAPCPAPLRDTMLRNLSVVEGMDLEALRAGTSWGFESFGEYLGFLRAQRPHLNVGVFAGHSTIRTAVMGEVASTRAEATPAEIAAMRALTRQAMADGAIGFASSFSPNHSGWGGAPMPSTIATDHELSTLVGVLGEVGRGVFMSATGPRASPDYMEALAAATGRPMFISTVLSMYSDEAPTRGLAMYDRCAEAQDRGREVYIQSSCQPLSFDFDLIDPYVLYSHDAFAPVKSAGGDRAALAALYADEAFRAGFRDDLTHCAPGILFTGDWSQIELQPARPENAALAERSIQALADAAGRDPIAWLFDFALAEGLETRLVGKFFNNRDEGVAPLLTHRAGVITLSDAGAHLTYLCDAGFGPHLLGHWVRDTATFSLPEAVRRLTSHPADLYRIPDRGRIAVGAWADLLLFDPAAIGIGRLRSAADLPGGGVRKLRDAVGVHGVWVNGVRTIADGRYVAPSGAGQVLDRFAA